MLDSPAAIIAQHGSRNCPLADQGASTSRRAPSTAARSLWPTIQCFADCSAPRSDFMACSPKSIVLQKIHHQRAKLCSKSSASFPESVLMCSVGGLLSEFCSQHFLREGLAANARGHSGRGHEWS